MARYQPTLNVYVTWFGESSTCLQYGEALYHHLTRPRDEPLAWGAGFPVHFGIDPDYLEREVLTAKPQPARFLAVVILLDDTTFELYEAQRKAFQTLKGWAEEYPELIILPVFLDDRWKVYEGVMTKTPPLVQTLEPGKRSAMGAFLDEVVLALCRHLDPRPPDKRQEVEIFVSHARTESGVAKKVARKIANYIHVDTTARAFFVEQRIHIGQALTSQLERAQANSVFLAVKSDQYPELSWCQKELLTAKRLGIPALAVEVLQQGERRSLAYGGNMPTLVWRAKQGAEPIVSQAMRAWLQHLHFQHEAPRLTKQAGVRLNPVVLTRPPELLDFSQEVLPADAPCLALYPDPELPISEQRVLQQAYPKLRTATPTTLFRRILDDAAHQTMPLEGVRFAMSLSSSPDIGGPEGFGMEHIQDATIHLARCLIGAGACLAYGGDLRRTGFTWLLARLASTYRETDAPPSELLHWYRAGFVKAGRKESPPASIHAVRPSGPDSILNALTINMDTPTDVEKALMLADVRRKMAEDCHARICMGGKVEPRGATAKGYSSRFPSQLEVAWFTLKKGRPLYVAGGFGGAARLLGSVLRARLPGGVRELPNLLDEARLREKNKIFDALCQAYDEHRKDLPIVPPATLEALFEELAIFGENILIDDTQAKAHNGLTLEENFWLLESRNPAEIAALVVRGLTRLQQQKDSSALTLHLYYGSIATVPGVQAYALGIFPDQPALGALRGLDQRLDGAFAAAAARMGEKRVEVLPIGAGRLNGDWAILVNMGSIMETRDLKNLASAVREAAHRAVVTAERLGFRSLALVPFGATVGLDAAEAFRRMLEGIKEGRGERNSMESVTFCEIDEARHGALLAEWQHLKGDDAYSLKRTSALGSIPDARLPRRAFLHLRREGKTVRTLLLPPSGNAALPVSAKVFTDDAVRKLVSKYKGHPPPASEVESVGDALTRDLFGKPMFEGLDELIERLEGVPLVVVHDKETSNIPVELLRFGGHFPALEGGLSRLAAFQNHSLEVTLKRRPRTSQLRVLLILDPTGELDEAKYEVEKIKVALDEVGGLVKPHILRGKATTTENWASREHVRDLLDGGHFDVVHFAGHAHFEPGKPEKSGLVCAGGQRLTAEDLREVENPPFLVFFNACQAGRIRDGGVEKRAPDAAVTGVAEMMLHAGVSHFLGSFWKVEDHAAALFAQKVYEVLVDAGTIGESVLEGRNALKTAGSGQWSNYMLFGQADFRLVTPEW